MTRIDPRQRAIFERYQPMGDSDLNTAVACDPSGFESVSEDVLAEVSHPRPPFNWPNRRLPLANAFPLQGMAIDVLKKSGFTREATLLSLRLHEATPKYDELPDLLWRFLDFEPAAPVAPAALAALREKAAELGVDPESIGPARKRPVLNPLAHQCKTLEHEWAWLVEHADSVSPFGKDAVGEVAPKFMSQLAGLWLRQLGAPLESEPNDPSVGNLAWFRARFPMGWAALDETQDTAVIDMGARPDFEAALTVAFFTLANHVDQGFGDLDDARRFAFEHRTAAGLYGSAVLSMPAEDHFKSKLTPALLGGRAGEESSVSSSPLVMHLISRLPSLASQPTAVTLWMAYKAVDPRTSADCESILSDPKNNDELKRLASGSSSSLAGFRSRLEKLALSSDPLTGIWPWETQPPALLRASAPRL